MTPLAILHRHQQSSWGKRVALATPDDDLHDDLGFDSVDLTTIAMEIEETLHLTITDAEIAAWQTVGDVCQVVGGQSHV